MDPFTVTFGLQMAKARDALFNREMGYRRRSLQRRRDEPVSARTASTATTSTSMTSGTAIRMAQVGRPSANAAQRGGAEKLTIGAPS